MIPSWQNANIVSKLFRKSSDKNKNYRKNWRDANGENEEEVSVDFKKNKKVVDDTSNDSETFKHALTQRSTLHQKSSTNFSAALSGPKLSIISNDENERQSKVCKNTDRDKNKNLSIYCLEDRNLSARRTSQDKKDIEGNIDKKKEKSQFSSFPLAHKKCSKGQKSGIQSLLHLKRKRTGNSQQENLEKNFSFLEDKEIPEKTVSDICDSRYADCKGSSSFKPGTCKRVSFLCEKKQNNSASRILGMFEDTKLPNDCKKERKGCLSFPSSGNYRRQSSFQESSNIDYNSKAVQLSKDRKTTLESLKILSSAINEVQSLLLQKGIRQERRGKLTKQNTLTRRPNHEKKDSGELSVLLPFPRKSDSQNSSASRVLRMFEDATLGSKPNFEKSGNNWNNTTRKFSSLRDYSDFQTRLSTVPENSQNLTIGEKRMHLPFCPCYKKNFQTECCECGKKTKLHSDCIDAGVEEYCCYVCGAPKLLCFCKRNRKSNKIQVLNITCHNKWNQKRQRLCKSVRNVCPYCNPKGGRQMVQVNSWKDSRQNLRRHKFANNLDDLRSSNDPEGGEYDDDVEEVCRCFEKYKLCGSEELPYQRLSAFSDVMNELQRKITESVRCTYCREIPCCCLFQGNETDQDITRKFPDSRFFGDQRELILESPPPIDDCEIFENGVNSCSHRNTIIQICEECNFTPCRCRIQTNEIFKPTRATCCYCKSFFLHVNNY